jgi:hypothetical protein
MDLAAMTDHNWGTKTSMSTDTTRAEFGRADVSDLSEREAALLIGCMKTTLSEKAGAGT